MSAVRIESCPIAQFKKVKFANIEGTIGGGLHIDDINYHKNTKLIIEDSEFTSLIGWCGAALYINNVEYVSIINTLF